MVSSDDPPTPAIMSRHLAVKTEDKNDYNSIHARRERAFQWHARWAMPPYDTMIKQVRRTKGLDITEADVDLLPWGPNKMLDRREFERLQNEQNLAEDRDNAAEIARERQQQEEEAARRRKEREEAHRRRKEEAERQRREAEEERKRLEAEAERKRLEAEAERKRLEEEERKRQAELERRRREEEERRRREEEERRRREEEERRRREEEAARLAELERQRLEEEARKRREEEERRRREEEERRRREEEAARLAELERQRREEEERKRREEEERRRREEEERRRREEEERRRREAEAAEKARLAELERQRREEEERKRREEEERRRREEEARRLAELERKRQEEAERKRREEELQRQRDAARKLPPGITDGDTPVERAYRCFEALAHPSKETMLAAIDKTDGLDVDEDDVDALPWKDGDKDLDYPKLHDLLDKEKKRRLMSEAQIKKLIELWKSLGRPNKEQFRQLILNIPDFNEDDISVLSWDENDTVVNERDPRDREAAARQRRKERMRRKLEEEEREKHRHELEVFKKQKHMRPPPPTIGDTPLERAYRWYFRLNGVKRDYMVNVANNEAVDFTAEDVHLLPWIKNGAILDFGRLKELLDEIEKKRKKDEKKRTNRDDEDDGDDEEKEERRKRAYHWYKELKKPKRETMYRLLDETDGMDIKKSDIDLLRWDTDRTYVIKAP